MSRPVTLEEGITKYDQVKLTYESWNAFVDRAAHGEFAPGVMALNYSDRNTYSSSHGGGGYGGLYHSSSNPTSTRSFEEAVDFATNGWPAGLKAVNELKVRLDEAIPPSITWKKETQFRQVGPGRIHMGRYLQDHQKPWMARVSTERLEIARSGRIVVLNYNVAASAMSTSEGIMKRGAAVCSLIDQLEQTGRRVEVILHYYTIDNPGTLDVKVYAKRAQDPLDMERIVFALANDAVQRRFGFAIKEQYGIPLSNPRTMNEPDSLEIPAPSFFEGYQDTDVIAWLKQVLANQGITTQED